MWPAASGRLVVLALVLSGAACTNETGPTEPLTTLSYTLVSIDGKSLPMPEETDSANTIISGSLVLIGNDSSRVLETVVSPGPTPITTYQIGYYSVQRSGDTLVLSPHYLASAVDTATAGPGEVTVRAHIRTAGGLVVESRVYVAQ